MLSQFHKFSPNAPDSSIKTLEINVEKLTKTYFHKSLAHVYAHSLSPSHWALHRFYIAFPDILCDRLSGDECSTKAVVEVMIHT